MKANKHLLTIKAKKHKISQMKNKMVRTLWKDIEKWSWKILKMTSEKKTFSL